MDGITRRRVLRTGRQSVPDPYSFTCPVRRLIQTIDPLVRHSLRLLGGYQILAGCVESRCYFFPVLRFGTLDSIAMKRLVPKRPVLVLRVWLIPIVMTVVAAIHMYQWNSIQRSSWGTGAGFGMFATVDYHGSRFFRCYLRTRDGWVRAEVPRDVFRNSGLIARAIPSTENLQVVVDQISGIRWKWDNDQSVLVSSPEASGDCIPVDECRLELWGMHLNSVARQLYSFKLNQWGRRINPGDEVGNHVAAH